MTGHGIQSLLAIGCDTGLVPELGKVIDEDVPGQGLVIDDQDGRDLFRGGGVDRADLLDVIAA